MLRTQGSLPQTLLQQGTMKPILLLLTDSPSALDSSSVWWGADSYSIRFLGLMGTRILENDLLCTKAVISDWRGHCHSAARCHCTFYLHVF